jgi:hypothetical protein
MQLVFAAGDSIQDAQGYHEIHLYPLAVCVVAIHGSQSGLQVLSGDNSKVKKVKLSP